MTTTRKILVAALIVVTITTAWAISAWFPSPKEIGYDHVLTWGETGSEPGQFSEPIGIVVSGNEVFVSDAGNHRIQAFDRNGKFLREFGYEGSGPGELSRPMHMDIRAGRLYVAEYLAEGILLVIAGLISSALAQLHAAAPTRCAETM